MDMGVDMEIKLGNRHKHGHGHAAWTWTFSIYKDIDIDMGIGMGNRHGHGMDINTDMAILLSRGGHNFHCPLKSPLSVDPLINRTTLFFLFKMSR
jgi:hypothetical protein